ncbi:FAD-binding protein, partial [Candidatus Bathyarchaeota archaeon]|nr:FAD-binding protein [Candidatus Bathyarchaeota archaeon]
MFLVVGGGGAGARAVIEANSCGVNATMVLKGVLTKSGTTPYNIRQAGGGRCAILASPNDPEKHFMETLKAAQGMSNERLARILAYEAMDRVVDLRRYGLELPYRAEDWAPARAHFHPFLATGTSLVEALKDEIERRGIEVIENTMITKILTDSGRVVGAIGIDTGTSEFRILSAKAVILATGGGGQLWLHSVNPTDVCGDGFAMAYRAGAELVNMEFQRTGFKVLRPIEECILDPELFMLHPKMYNGHHEEFLKNYVPEGIALDDCFDLRSQQHRFTLNNASKYVDLAIYNEIRDGRGTENGGVFLDFTHIPRESIRGKSKGCERIYDWLLSNGVDISKEPLEIVTATHSFYGGIRIDERCESTIRGLFAAGEVVGNIHGADRLGGNSLIDCQVFGARAGRNAAIEALSLSSGPPQLDEKQVDEEHERIFQTSFNQDPNDLKTEVQRVAWENVHLVKNENNLNFAMGEFLKIQKDLQKNTPIETGRVVDSLIVQTLA